MTPKYSLIIRWSEEDQCYIAWVPEFGNGVKTHGSTYEEAARMGQEIIELVSEPDQDARPLPEPWLYTDPETDDVVGKKLFPSNSAYQDPIHHISRRIKHAST